MFCVQKVVNITPVMAHNLFELCCKHFYYTSLWVVTGSTENTLTIPPFPLLQTLSNTIATLEQWSLLNLHYRVIHYIITLQTLKLENIEFVVTPYEANGQLAHMSQLGVENGGVAMVITEDSDLIAYGYLAVRTPTIVSWFIKQ